MRGCRMAVFSVVLLMAGFFGTTGSAAAKTDPAALPHLGTCPTPITVGNRGPCVEELQRTLRKVGLNVVQDANFGQQTKGAVIAFQAQEGLPKVGYVGPQTREALIRVANSDQPARSFRDCPQLKPGLFHACVARFVREFSSIPGNPDLGRTKLYDQSTANAVMDYQRRNGLVVDGVVGRQTADLVDVQAGPKEVCFAMEGDALGPNGECQGAGAVGMGRSVWSCVQDIFGVELIRDIARDKYLDRVLATTDSKEKFIRALARVTKAVGSTAVQGAVCVSFG